MVVSDRYAVVAFVSKSKADPGTIEVWELGTDSHATIRCVDAGSECHDMAILGTTLAVACGCGHVHMYDLAQLATGEIIKQRSMAWPPEPEGWSDSFDYDVTAAVSLALSETWVAGIINYTATVRVWSRETGEVCCIYSAISSPRIAT